MINKTILSSGEKIKKLRKELNLTQTDLSGTEITRNLISYIENGKATLTRNVASIIVNNIRSICKERNIHVNITEDYLLEDAELQASKLADEYAEILETKYKDNLANIETIINQIENLFANFDLVKKRVDIYKKIGDIYRINQKYMEAYTYYIKAYENCGILSSNIENVDIPLCIIFCCLKLQRNSEIIELYNLVHTLESKIPKDIYWKFVFNSAIAYMRLNKYEDCLKQIDYLEKNFELSLDTKFNLSSLKTSCYQSKMHYSDALDIQKLLLQDADKLGLEKNLIVLCNILEIYTKLHDSFNLREYLKKCLKLINEYENSPSTHYLPDIYLDISLTLKEIKNLELAKTYFLKCILESKKNPKVSILSRAFENLISIFIEENDLKRLNDLKNLLMEFISLQILPKNDMLIFRLIKYYNKIEDKETISDILNFILQP